MLKRLEMVGFKSFADKMRFDFSDGITCIVGPNGSGKSNVVDAVRWVLGEQSAKSLRGGEMADVIFNGSASRRSLGMAEVSITFDNSRKLLSTDAAEVQITRRVYRSGEGEYLINQLPCRLKDIKDLFLGSGAGGDAYCIIEQGRVDMLLQASTQERRTIFEEAAGISRFKARKIETLRRLERVEQNLLRLLDIIGEVEKQYRSVKLQAAKAQRFQEHSNRLRELRVALSLDEFHLLAGQLQAETAVLDRLRSELGERAAQAQSWERQVSALESSLGLLDASVQAEKARLASAREQITAEKTALDHEWSLAAELTNDRRRTLAQLAEMNSNLALLLQAIARLDADLSGIGAEASTQAERAQSLERDYSAAAAHLAQLHSRITADKNAHLEQMRRAAHLQNDAVSFKAHLENLRREHDRLLHRSAQVSEHLASIDLELQDLKKADDALQARMTAARQGLAEQKQERDQLRQERERTTAQAAELRAQWSGLTSRIDLLDGLERSNEGLGTGVREVREKLRQPVPGHWETVVGMVADLITVKHEFAPLIDLAVGEMAQHFVVRDVRLLEEALGKMGQPLAGRVSFLSLERPVAAEDGTAPANRLIELSTLVRMRMPVSPEGTPIHAGVVAAADSLVTCDRPELKEFPRQLLRHTLLVRDLAAARGIAEHATGYRFVTIRGELLDADGTLTVGTYRPEAGLISRKSELRELREQSTALEQRVRDTERDLGGLRERIARLEERIQQRQEEIDVLSEQIGDLRSRIGQHKERRNDLHEEVEVSRSEISGLADDIQRGETSWTNARQEAEAAERRVQDLQTRIEQAEEEARRFEQAHQQKQQECTAAKVALAQVEERLKAVRSRRRQVETDREQRQQEQAQVEKQLQAARTRLEDSQRAMLRSSAEMAHLYLSKEAAERKLLEHDAAREKVKLERAGLQEQVQASHAAWHAQQQELHACELKVNDLEHQRSTLVARLREDYLLELAEIHEQGMATGSWPSFQPPRPIERVQHVDEEQPPSPSNETAPAAALPSPAEPTATTGSHCPPPIDAEAANQEIEELRRKLARLGAVNLDSLQELVELEQRAETLKTQHDDLASAKNSLVEIIAKINDDSRRLFVETLQTVRSHFQELFRKLFGGGMADIVLEDENDVLESGIEIIARPPGKELRSISLMSGGEKTLTAVGLLFAIFRSKPSPFCLLDEVDAALDEANIGRFTSVLREFLDLSQFIIITHSKRTMSAADVLYGVTMQESGISRRVAVRFDDWPDDDKKPQDEAKSDVA
jgi:chromosome segregation protein